MTIGGRRYLTVVSYGASPQIYGKSGGKCAAGLPISGFPRIIDISDEKNPKTVSKLMLEITDPTHCAEVENDPTIASGYSSAYCSADDTRNAKMLACAYSEGGLRVFDIRDVRNPREIAYYKPAAWRSNIRKGSYFGIFGGVFTTPSFEAAKAAGRIPPPLNDHTADAVLFATFKDQGEIWLVSADGGFQIVRFSDRLKESERDLFQD